MLLKQRKALLNPEGYFKECVILRLDLYSLPTLTAVTIALIAMEAGIVAWTKNPKLGVGGSFMVASDVSIPKECCDKISELL